MSLGAAYVAIRADLKPLAKGLKTGWRMVSTTIGKMGGVIKGLGRTLTSMKTLAIAAFAGWGITKLLKASVGGFMDFEVALNRVGNVSKEALDVVKGRVRGISATLGGVTDLVKGYYQVISAGVTNPLKAMALLRQASKLAKESQVDQGEAVKGLAALMGSYREEIESTADAADTLYTIERLGITSVSQLIPLIGNLANLSKATGLNVNEMAAGLAQITTTGAGTAIAVTQMQSLLTALNKGFARMPESVKKYGSAANAVKQIGFQGVLEEISRATGNNATELTQMLGRQEAVLAFIQLSKNDFEGFANKIEEMGTKTGSAESAWTRYEKTLRSIWDTFKTIINNQLVMIGERLAPKIKELVLLMGDWLKKMQDPIVENFGRILALIPEALVNIIKGLTGGETKLSGFSKKIVDFIKNITSLVNVLAWTARTVDRILSRVGLIRGGQWDDTTNSFAGSGSASAGGGTNGTTAPAATTTTSGGGNTTTNNITVSPTFMTGDANAAQNVAVEVGNALADQGQRWDG